MACGADLNAANSAGSRAADLARSGGHEQAAALLEAALASPDAQREVRAAGEAALRAVEGAVAQEVHAAAGVDAQEAGAHPTACRIVRAQRAPHESLQRPISSIGGGGGVAPSSARPAEWTVTEYGGGALRVFEAVT